MTPQQEAEKIIAEVKKLLETNTKAWIPTDQHSNRAEIIWGKTVKMTVLYQVDSIINECINICDNSHAASHGYKRKAYWTEVRKCIVEHFEKE